MFAIIASSLFIIAAVFSLVVITQMVRDYQGAIAAALNKAQAMQPRPVSTSQKIVRPEPALVSPLQLARARAAA